MSNNGTKETYFEEFSANEMQQGIAFMSALVDRMALSGQMGMQYAGQRDLFQELGYPKVLGIEDYEARYERDGLSARVVDKPANDTWRRAPVIHDGDEKGPTDTEFVQALEQMAKRLRLWRVFKDLDQETGIGRYGVLLIGIRDNAELDQEAPAQLNGPEDVVYLRPYRESQVSFSKYETDRGSARFGRPVEYEIDLGEVDGKALGRARVHWTRVIHVAEDSIDGVFGRPRMKRSFNRLMDVDKVVGSGAEAVWRLIYKGLVVSEKEGYEITDNADALEDEFLKLLHKFKRVIVAGGVETKELGASETPDPSGIFGIIIDLVSADTGIPKRILMGSERGELASSMDAKTWSGEVTNRQTQFAEPAILRPFVDWCIARAALPAPVAGTYAAVWPPLLEQDEGERVDTNLKRMEILERGAKAGVVEFGYMSTDELRRLADFAADPEGETVEDMLDEEDMMSEEVEA